MGILKETGTILGLAGGAAAGVAAGAAGLDLDVSDVFDSIGDAATTGANEVADAAERGYEAVVGADADIPTVLTQEQMAEQAQAAAAQASDAVTAPEYSAGEIATMAGVGTAGGIAGAAVGRGAGGWAEYVTGTGQYSQGRGA